MKAARAQAGGCVGVQRKGAVQIIRLTDAATRNALTDVLRVHLSAALREAAADPGIRAIYLTGSGASFCAGGDVNALKALKRPVDVHRRFRNLGAWLLPLLQIEKPVVVGLNGYAVGGGLGLALAGDIVVAARSAKLIPGFFRLGLVPDVSMLYTLPRLIGMVRTRRFLMLDEGLSAAEALELGMISQVVADEDLDRTCMELAARCAAKPAAAMGLTKLFLARSFESSAQDMFLYEGLGQSVAMFDGEFEARLDALMAPPAGRTKKAKPGSAAAAGGSKPRRPAK